jgi:hypothetical protein
MVLPAARRADARTNEACNHKQEESHKYRSIELNVRMAVYHRELTGVCYHTAAWTVIW